MKKIFDKKIVLSFIAGAVTFMAFSVNADITYNAEGVLYKKGNDNVALSTELDNLNSYINYGNASSDTILKGKSALVSGKKITGSMNNYSNDFVWINTDNGTFSNNINYTYSDGRVTNQVVGFSSNTRKGYFDGSTKFIFGEKKDIESYIKSGTKFLGVDGTYTNDATATANDIVKGKTAYVNGKKITGTAKTYNEGYTDGQSNSTGKSIVNTGVVVTSGWTPYGGEQQCVIQPGDLAISSGSWKFK